MPVEATTKSVGESQSIDVIRRFVSSNTTVSFVFATLFGLLTGLLYIVASNLSSLPKAIACVGGALLVGVLGLLVINEMLVIAMHPVDSAPETAPPGANTRPVAVLRWLFIRHRWPTLIVLAIVIVGGLTSVTDPGSGLLRHTIRGESIGTLLTVAGLVTLTVWVQAWLLSLERGVLVTPEAWLWLGLTAAVVGALLWSLARGPLNVAGAIIGLAGIAATKMSLLPLVERVSSIDGTLPSPTEAQGRRRFRAVDLIVGGAVVAAGGAMLMAGGAAEERASFLTLGLLAAIVGLSLAGVAAVSLTFASPTAERLFGTAAIALGVLATTWGALKAVDAAGDWLWLVLVACLIPVVLGAWFVFRGEGIIVIALITFVAGWAMHDRETERLEHLRTGAASETLVAIGDSFMSGEGARDFLHGTNSPATNQCRRALNAYSARLAEDLQFRYRTVACSGAKIENLKVTGGVAQMPRSPETVSGGKTQLAELADDPSTTDAKIVLVSIGGNDTGFSSIIQACLLPTNCAEHEELYIAKAESLKDDLVATYQEIDRVTGDAIVLVVPYPNYIRPTACDRLASGEEFEFVDRFITALNGTIARAARDADVLVADMNDVFAGHTQCDHKPAANLVVLAPPGGTSLLDRLSPANWVHGSMHPYEAGHQLEADRLKPLVSKLRAGCATDDDCRPRCSGGGVSPVVASLVNDENRRLVDVCHAPLAVTDAADAAALTAEANLLLARGVKSELYDSAGLLVWPLMALVSGGLLIAVGLINRKGLLAKVALFLAPIRSPVPEANNDDRLHVVPLASERDKVTLLGVIARSRSDQGDDIPEPVTVALEPCDGPPGRSLASASFDRWTYFAGGRHSFWWSKATVDNLAPGTAYEVTGPLGSVSATAVTLPAQGATHASIVVGSCYYRANPCSDGVARVYQDLVGDDLSVLHFWLGDQVYVDLPWRSGLRADSIRDQVAKRYLDSWEIGTVGRHDPEDRPIQRDPDERFGYVLRRSANRFLPDDHEFWNGYPKISYRTLPRHAAARRWQALRQRLSPGRAAATDHPATQGPFGSTAGLAYLIFQSPVTGMEAALAPEHSPDAIQEIELGLHPDGARARIIMVDTRWRRTISTGCADRDGFCRAEDLDDLDKLLAEDGLVVLMLSRPLAGYPPRRFRSPWSEQVVEHYRHQYDRLCRSVAARAATAPTVVVAGDVHHYALHTAGGGRLLQVVSSPIVLHGRPHPSHNPFWFPDTASSPLIWMRGNGDDEIVENLSSPADGEGGLVRLDVDLGREPGPRIHFRYRSITEGSKEHTRLLTWADGRWSDGPAGRGGTDEHGAVSDEEARPDATAASGGPGRSR